MNWPWYAWALIALQVVSALLSVLLIGRPREPRTAGEATVGLILSGLIIWAIVALAEKAS